MDFLDQTNHGLGPAGLAQFWKACSRVHSQTAASSVAERVVQAVRAVPGVGFRTRVLLTDTGTLGLHLVVSLARRLGGAIELKRGSGVWPGGEGTMVEIRFPKDR